VFEINLEIRRASEAAVVKNSVTNGCAELYQGAETKVLFF
jgi:hypothetical protein